jgi:glucoamylase
MWGCLDWGVAWARAGIALGGVALGVLALSGGHRGDARTPAGLPGLPPPFLGVAVVGNGGRTAAVDAYGDVVDLRAPGPVGRALTAVPAKRQVAGTVPTSTARVARAQLSDGRSLPLWRGDAVRQRYLPGTNVLRTVARFGDETRVFTHRLGSSGAVAADRRWLAQARRLGGDAPRWAGAMYRRSLLVLRALTDRRSGAVAAGPRDGWAYVWPRDAAAVALALASAGYGGEARRVAHFLQGLELSAAARFRGSGAPVPGRGAQGDAAGWVAAAARAAGLPTHRRYAWRDRADYQEGDSGDYLGNAIATAAMLPADGPETHLYRRKSAHRVSGEWVASAFGTPRGLMRVAGDPGSGLDSAAAWAVRPFALPTLFPEARHTLHRLVATAKSHFGIVPSENWQGGDEPWTAPTAWAAWALAALSREEKDARQASAAREDRHLALRLMADLRRAATPLGMLPERVDPNTGLPTSTTPLAWSHAFAILAIRELWHVRR